MTDITSSYYVVQDIVVKQRLDGIVVILVSIAIALLRIDFKLASILHELKK